MGGLADGSRGTRPDQYMDMLIFRSTEFFRRHTREDLPSGSVAEELGASVARTSSELGRLQVAARARVRSVHPPARTAATSHRGSTRDARRGWSRHESSRRTGSTPGGIVVRARSGTRPRPKGNHGLSESGRLDATEREAAKPPDSGGLHSPTLPHSTTAPEYHTKPRRTRPASVGRQL